MIVSPIENLRHILSYDCGVSTTLFLNLNFKGHFPFCVCVHEKRKSWSFFFLKKTKDLLCSASILNNVIIICYLLFRKIIAQYYCKFGSLNMMSSIGDSENFCGITVLIPFQIPPSLILSKFCLSVKRVPGHNDHTFSTDF